MAVDYDALFPPDKFIKVSDVPVFDEHSGDRLTKDGKPVKVDEKELLLIAETMNRLLSEKHTTAAITLGHTLDGDISEALQPDVAGWAVNFKVLPFLKTGKKVLCPDFYYRKKYEYAIEEYPGVSVEYYPALKEVRPIALLKSSVPQRNLPVIKFSTAGGDQDCYRYAISSPLPSTLSTETPMPMDSMTDPVKDAQAAEGKSVKSTEAKLDALTEMVKQLTGILMQAMQAPEGEGEGDGDKKDLLAPAEGEDEFDDEDEKDGDAKPKSADKAKGKGDKPEPAKDEKDSRKESGETPVKFDAQSASPTNCYTPDTKDKTKMAREDENVLKFQREVTKLANENRDLKLKFQRATAEKTVAEWEGKHFVLFPSAEARQNEIDLMSHLDDDSFKAHEKRALLLYSRKTPAGDAVQDVAKYARTPEGDKPALGSADDVAAFITKLDNGTLTGTYEEALAKFKGKK